MHNLENSSAAKVWEFFEKICEIPHGSGNEAALLAYIENWAAGKGFKTARDATGNLVVYAPGTAGYENSPVLIMQSHVDMVCEKNGDSAHNFEKDPIRLLRDGDFLRADGTTLGADNGLGAAMMLAVMDGEAAHPPIEAVFTVDEEIGLVGASHFDMSLLSGKRFINLDTEEEGVFIASNAGGRHAKLIFPAQWQPAPGFAWFRLEITGLHGGHSGMDIDKERGNAIRLMGRVLYELRAEAPSMALAFMQAGSKENAIPRESACLVGLPAGSEAGLSALVARLQATFQKELVNSDGGVKLECTGAETPEKVLTAETRDKLMAAILLVPNGALHMSTDIPGLVESSNNLGVVETTEESIVLIYCARSSVGTRKEAIFQQVGALMGLLGGSCEVISDYPAWEFNPHSELREKFIPCFEKLEGKKPVVTAVHCGLECGIFSDAIPGLDVLSIGPDLIDVHSPQEHVSISSTERVWELLKAGLATLK